MTPVDLIISTVQAGDTFCVTHFYRAQSAVAQPWQRYSTSVAFYAKRTNFFHTIWTRMSEIEIWKVFF